LLILLQWEEAVFMSKGIVDATVLLRCAGTPHDCEGLRDALVEVDGVTEAFITNTKIHDVKYCVGGTVVATSARTAQLRKDVMALKKSKKRLNVDKVAMLVGSSP